MPLPNPAHYHALVTLQAMNVAQSLADLLVNFNANPVKYFVDANRSTVELQSDFENGAGYINIGFDNSVGTGVSPSSLNNWAKKILAGMVWTPNQPQFEAMYDSTQITQQPPGLGCIWLIGNQDLMTIGVEIHKVFRY